MLLFFLILALMVLAAVGLVVTPVMRSRPIRENPRNRQNVAIARDRLAQLQAQVEAGAVSPDEAERQKAEIELALLDDVAGGDTDLPSAHSLKGRWAGMLLIAAIPVVAGGLYLSLGRPAALSPLPPTPAADVAAHTDGDFAGMVKLLEDRLKAAPDDAEGWYVLGNSYMTLKQFDRAAAAFGRLRELAGDDPELMVRHADALAMAQGGVLAGEPERLILAALEQQPDHPVALWLAGIAAQRNGDVVGALAYWGRAEPLFRDDPESLAELQSMIAQARRGVESAGGTPAPEPGAAKDGEPRVADQGAVGGGSITVHVTLQESLTAEVNETDTLFVLARAVSGPPMPLAVVRKQVRDLPLTVTLDDTMSMVAGMKLSNYAEVAVVAKVSKSGQARTQSGDLIGEVSPVSPGQAQPVNVVISAAAP